MTHGMYVKAAGRTILAVAIAVGAFCCPPAGAATHADDFADGTISGTLWSPPPTAEGACALTETNGRVEFTSDVTPGNGTRAWLDSRVYARQDADWTTSIYVCIDGNESLFPGMGAGDVIASGLTIAPSGPASESDGEDRIEMNFAFVDASLFGGTGFDHGVRFNGRTNGSDDESILTLLHPAALGATVKLDYSAATGTVTGSYDIGSGFVTLGDAVDTGAWGMTPDEVFQLQISGSAGVVGSGSPTNTFSVAGGQFYMDNFSATGGVGVPPGVVILDDHFRGNSGTVPGAWTSLMNDEGSGGIVESGSTVTLQDSNSNGTVIGSSTSFNPQGVETTLHVEYQQISASGKAAVALINVSTMNMFIAQLRTSDGRVEVTAGDANDGQYNELAFLGSYSGGWATMDITLDANSFRITTDIEGYDSGDLLYTDVFPTSGFTLSDLGSSVVVAVLAMGEPSGWAAVDRVTVTTIPEPATLSLLVLGACLPLLRRRR